MKRSILIVLTLLLLLTACQTVPGPNDGTASSIPTGSTTSSTGAESPTSTPDTGVPDTIAPDTTIPATSVPTTNPPALDETGYSFIYDGDAPFIGIDADYSGCTVGHLYWVDKTSGEVSLILAEPVLESMGEGAYVYYVKADEPMKIYRTPIGAFAQHGMIYESTHGKVSEMLIDTYVIREQLVLQFVADKKKFVVLDLNTGEDTILTEQYYIRSAMFDHSCTDTWDEQTNFVFWGKLDENDSIQSYRYFIKTGEIRQEGECAD
jgi:hypothetical protein